MTIHQLAQGGPASNGSTETASAPNRLTELRRGDTVTADCPTGAAGAANRSNHVLSAIDTMFAEQERRHAWLADAAAKIARWREEDRLNGQPWGDDDDA